MRRVRAWLVKGLPVFSIVGALASIVLLVVLLRSAAARSLRGLVFAGDPARATEILTGPTWLSVSDEAYRATRIDLALIAAYVIALMSTSLWLGPRLRTRSMRGLAIPAALAALSAGALDVIEDVGLFRMMDGHLDHWAVITTAAAWPKFFLLVASITYAAFAAGSRVKDRLTAWYYRSGTRRSGHLERYRPTLALVPQSLPKDVVPRVRPEMGDCPSWRAGEWTPTSGRIGIACSGGGIRSASYNLGALQALRERGIFERASFLTAVSGGGYIAGAHAIVERETSDEQQSSFCPPDGIRGFAPRSPEERHLRANTSYIAPDMRGKVRFAVRLLVGLTINVVLTVLTLFVVTRPIGWMFRNPSIHSELASGQIGRFTVDRALWLAVVWPFGIAILLMLWSVLRRFRRDASYRGVVRAAVGAGALSGSMCLILIVLPWIGVTVPKMLRAFLDWLPGVHQVNSATMPNYVWLFTVTGVAALGGSVLVLLRRNATRLAMFVAGFVVPLGLLVSAGLFIVSAARTGPGGDVVLFGVHAGSQWIWFVTASLLLLVFYAASDQTTWSMYPFYKRRLSLAFAVQRTSRDEVQPVPYDELQRLSRYEHIPSPDVDACGRRFPELVLCAAANISDPGAIPTGRRAVAFTFGPKEIGGRDIGWLPTRDMEEALGRIRREDVTLPAAMAISGAALSPAMGKMTRPTVRAILAIANARLGVWLPNPSWVARLADVNASLEGPPVRMVDRPRVSYLVKEIFGIHPRHDKFLYVTDGGHFENLGLVELLRRGCTEIYCFDAAGDAVDTFFTLGEAVALARSDLGVDIDIDPEIMAPPLGEQPAAERPLSPVDHVEATFRYPPDATGHRVKGKLFYAKAAVTEADPWDVKAYAQKDEAFPTHGTVHQLYLEQRFEAYRALGHAAGHAVATLAE